MKNCLLNLVTRRHLKIPEGLLFAGIKGSCDH